MVEYRTITTTIARVSWEKDFIRIKFLPSDKAFDLEEAKRQYEAAKQLAKGQRYKVLIDIRDVHISPEKDAQEFLSQLEEKVAEAILVNNLAARILSKFYVKMTSNNETKIFSKEKKAVDWLKNQ
jgi:hypothetical protein